MHLLGQRLRQQRPRDHEWSTCAWSVNTCRNSRPGTPASGQGAARSVKTPVAKELSQNLQGDQTVWLKRPGNAPRGGLDGTVHGQGPAEVPGHRRRDGEDWLNDVRVPGPVRESTEPHARRGAQAQVVLDAVLSHLSDPAGQGVHGGPITTFSG